MVIIKAKERGLIMKFKLIPLFALSALFLVGCTNGENNKSSATSVNTSEITTISTTLSTSTNPTTSQIKPSPVTSDEWEAAINQIKTQNIIVTGISEVAGSGNSNITMKSVENIMFIETKVESTSISFTQQEYYAKVNGATPSYFYYLSVDTGRPFTKRSSTEDEYLYGKSEVFLFDLEYDNYTYDESSGLYNNIEPVVIQQGGGPNILTYTNIKVKFINGKLTNIDFNQLLTTPNGSANSTMTMTYQKHGEPLELVLPEVDD